ncbi:head completion/stabilization protein [Motiliproteus sp.]|uniref:head completion/stabilization protein n=1 Tax=Motiliproteus sp. TaxID=1898955 RepID=UPI003BAC09B2
MTGFVADTPERNEHPINNTGFWPDIDPEHCRRVVRLPSDITAPRLREALINAMLSVNLDNAAWGAQQQADSYATLADIPADQIDGNSIKVSLYRRAVYCFAKADLLDRYADIDSTGSAERGQLHTDTADDYRRQGILAVRNMIGQPLTSVELI